MTKRPKIIISKLALLIICFVLISIYLSISNFKKSKAHLSQVIRDKVSISQSRSTPPQKNTLTLIATGDVMLGRTVNSKTTRMNDFVWPFEKTKDLLASADITLINLEGTLTKDCTTTTEGMRFCGDQRQVQGLFAAGVDVVNLANNHTGDFGKKGFEETRDILSQNNILITGVSGPVYANVNNMKLAFLGYNDISQYISVIPLADQITIKKEVLDASKNSDLVITSFHWGVEYTDKPTKRQIELAHLAIDSGADVVIGHHPHWIQPVEMYNSKLIIYSLGNFIFDQEWSQKTKEGNIAKIVLTEDGVKNYELIPVLIKDFGQPEIVSSF